MYANSYGSNAYNLARQCFVFKKPVEATPDNLAKHRQQNLLTTTQPGSLIHFVWQDSYSVGDDIVDDQHKDFFVIAEKLLATHNKDEMLDIMFNLYQHVKEHFSEEEALMKNSVFHHYTHHVKEHNVMLEKLMEMDKKIQNGPLNPDDIELFLDKWTKHIVNSDMAFNQHWKEMNIFSI